MKTSELKKSVEGNAFKLAFIGDWVDFLDKDDVKRGYVSVTYPNMLCIFDSCPKNIAQLILDYAYTPLAEREEEKKYSLKSKLFEFGTERHLYLINSTIHKQYCLALNVSQSFTQKEIDDMPFDTNFFIKEETNEQPD